MSRWLKWHDGVNVLLADRTELGWFGIEERNSAVLGVPGAEYVPEHLHYNWKHTDAYQKSKERRGKTAANIGEFRKDYSNSEYW